MDINSIQTNNSIIQTTVNSNQSQNAGAVIRNGLESAVTINAKDLGFTIGQTFSGQIVDVNGANIKLLLGNNQMINAKLEGNLNAILGQTLSFEVSSTEGGNTALRPLYTNLTNSPAVSNALQSAGLPETVQYINMVSAMMDESMPVNKNALLDMSKNINLNPLADPATIVQMVKIGIPINEITINQFENYKSFEHQIKNDVINLANGLVDEMDNTLKEANPELYSENMNETAERPQVISTVNNIINSIVNVVTGSNTEQVDTPEKLPEELSEELSEDTQTEPDFSFNMKGIDVASKILDIVDTSSDVLDKPVTDEIMNIVDKVINASEDTPKAKLSFGEVMNLIKDLIAEMKMDDENFPEEKKQMLSKLLSNDDFRDNLKDVLAKQLFLKPNQVTDKASIDDLYQKILKQADTAISILKTAGRENPEVMKAASNLNDNVNFMNQLNQAVTYVQIPLIMNQQSAHGDLYVYTNKKSLKEKDGNFSALLHLDMDNLGPMDVYISMTNGTNVTTNFTMQDQETLDFIADHIELLNDRLTKKGYNMSTNMTVKDKNDGKTSLAEEFMKDDPDSVSRVAVKYSFDVRA